MRGRLIAAVLALCAVTSVTAACSALDTPDDPVAAPSTTRFTVEKPLLGSTIPKPGKLIWSDEFSGAAGEAPSARWWTLATGGKGWGNREVQCYTDSRENSATNGKGQLVISAVHQSGHRCSDGSTNNWTSARMSTEGKFSARYGRLELRAKLPAGKGTWPAFWGLGINHSQVGWPRSGELDVMEYIGNRPTESTGTISSELRDGRKATVRRYDQRRYPVESQALTKDFHTFALDWSPTSMTFSRDGTVFGQITKAEVLQQSKWPFDQPFFFILNLAMGGNYGKAVPATLRATQRYTVDYVRVYALP